MKKILLFSLAALAWADSAQVKLDEVKVEGSRIDAQMVKNVAEEEIKSGDLAEALSGKVSSVSLIRRSGVANDILLRGQKRDNINVLIDDAKVCGACPNRMDPPTSHVVSNNVENVEIIEGPYDVENFGTLSGIVNIDTKKPKKDFGGNVSLNAGSYGYKKASTNITGGTDKVKFIIGASTESGEQYEDGAGKTMAEQLESKTPASMQAARFQDKYKDLDAFEKDTFSGKVFVDINNNHELQLGYTANRSDNVLYPNSSMDAIYDDSDIFTAKYIARNLGTYSKELTLDYYYSTVEHPMSTIYRKSALILPDKTPGANEMTSYLETETQGVKLKNTLMLNEIKTTLGLDSNTRNWDGNYFRNGKLHVNALNIPDVDTKNNAMFVMLEKDISNVNIKFGSRYDDTSVEPNKGNYDSNDYNSLNANIFATYKADDTTKYFAGIGKSTRVPDARELYFISSMGKMVGTPDLDQTKNYEIDFGVEKEIGNAQLKSKIFYSMLKDYIYYNANPAITQNNFENIDAKIYGIDVGGMYLISNNFNADFSVSFQKGKKDEALDTQDDRDLADVPPLKALAGLNYEYDASLNARIEVAGSDNWSSYDEDNGEQELGGWGVVNLKVSKDFMKNFNVTVGVDNVFDKEYALSNTYKDLTLVTNGTDINDVVLLNEPGRYCYINATYRF